MGVGYVRVKPDLSGLTRLNPFIFKFKDPRSDSFDEIDEIVDFVDDFVVFSTI